MNECYSNIVILCVGTYKIIGDAVGPIVGEKLKILLKENENVIIYGTKDKIINCKNIKKILEEIYLNYEKPYIITIDAALGKESMIENVVLSKGMTKLGNALGHNICYASDMNIKGIVGEYNISPQENMNTLKNVNKHCIDRVSNKIVYKVCELLDNVIWQKTLL